MVVGLPVRSRLAACQKHFVEFSTNLGLTGVCALKYDKSLPMGRCEPFGQLVTHHHACAPGLKLGRWRLKNSMGPQARNPFFNLETIQTSVGPFCPNRLFLRLFLRLFFDMITSPDEPAIRAQ
jgi:hypothetical protein